MAVLPVAGLAVAALVTALAYLSFARYAAARRDRPGAPAFGAFAALMVPLPAVVLVGAEWTGLRQWDLLPSVWFHLYAPLWAWFVLTYTGEEDRVSRPQLALFVVPPAVGVLVTGVAVATGTGVGGRDPVSATYLLVVMYEFALVFGGAFLLVRAGYTYTSTDRRRALALAAGALVPVVFPLTLNQAAFPAGPVPDSFVLAYLLSVLPFGAAVFRGDLFESVPVAEAVGRDTVVSEMDDAVVVVDDDDRVVDVNEAAERTFDRPAGQLLDRPFAPLLDGRPAAAVGDGETVALDHPTPVRHYEVSRSELTDDDGTRLGHALFFHDVTERRDRRRRLDVLNRVLRHNLRTGMQIVDSRSRAIVSGETDDPAVHAAAIGEASEELQRLGRRAREIDRLMETDPVPGDRALAPLVDDAVDGVRPEFPGATYANEVPPDLRAAVDPDHFEVVLTNLLDNAVRHHPRDDPRVTVREADADRHPVRIAVVDDGPGIPDAELSVIRNGEETPLEHASGLGLWTVSWGADRLGGDVEFDTGDGGTTVTLGLPGPSGDGD